MRMSLIPPPHVESYVSYLAAMQVTYGPETRTAALGDEPVRLPALQFLKSLDDLDEEEDEDDDELDLDDDVKPLKMTALPGLPDAVVSW